MEEAASAESVESVQSAEHQTSDASLIDANSNSTWNISEGIPGEGDKPEFFNSDKYSSIFEQAKAQREAEKRLGGFTGAPENYELSIDDGIQAAINHESEEFKAFEQLARDSNMNNDTFNSLVNTYLKSVDSFQNQEIPAEVIEEHRNEEMAKLGDNASSIINEVSSWGKNNLTGEEFDVFRGLADTADNIRVLQKLIKKSTATQISASDSTSTQYTREQLGEMINDKYYADREYRQHVDKLWADHLAKN